jgi:periplasmic protein CpxP/Spy
MPISSEERETIVNEVKMFAKSLNLSQDQKDKLHGFLTDAHEKLQAYKQENPKVSREDLMKKVASNRSAIRERLVHFLTPEQLTKWDTEVAKAKDFLVQRAASA